MPSILIADDDQSMCLTLSMMLGRQWDVTAVNCGQKAIDHLSKRPTDVALVDVYMPGIGGLQVLRALREKRIPTDVVMITGQGTIDLAVDAMKLGANDFLVKPLATPVLIERISELMRLRHPFRSILSRRLDEYLKSNLANVALNLKHVCHQFCISEGYVCRQFREGFGTTFRARLNRHRIDEAKRLIANSTPLPMKSVAQLCGYRNQRRFCEAFRRLEGLTPTNYRYGLSVPNRR